MNAKPRRQNKAKRGQAKAQTRPAYVARRRLVLGLMTVAACLLVTGAWYQQIVRTEFLQQKGDQKHLSHVDVAARRGRILDRHGEVLAVSSPVDSVWADPRWLRQDSETIRTLASLLDQDPDALRQRLAEYKNKHFVYLSRWLNPADAQRIVEQAREKGIKGVDLQREYRRYYPTGEVFSHVIGFAGRDDKGQEGLELQYEEVLRSISGKKLVRRDAKRQLLETVASIQPEVPGKDLVLSIDRRLQFFAYQALKKAVKNHRANSASLVLLDVSSGEILAMVGQPAYNPNSNRSNKNGRLRNRPITDTFEPGSTMKPMTVASALELGVITPDTSIDMRKGVIKVGANKVKDPRDYGSLDPAGVLLRSSNVGAATIAMKMPKKSHWKMLNRFGFGDSVQVGFPGEASGHLRDYMDWADIDHATLAFGYGISVSTLQLARAYSILAADGVRRPASLLRIDKAVPGERVISAETARQVRGMMEGVTTSAGTAPKAAIPGFRVAGKTGTAKKPGKRGYTTKKYRSLFAGMAPASDPRLVMVVVFDEPKGKEYYGGLVAGPVFSEVMSHALRLMNIAPDNDDRTPQLRLATAGSVQ